MAETPTEVTSRRQKLLLVAFGLALFVVLVVLVEATLSLLDAGDPQLYEDPYVGFAPGQDLFERRTLPSGEEVFATRAAKLAFFNEQSFATEKPAGGYRVFALGGSTTAGRPYDARVAFPRWLELYLRASDPSRSWEVINAGAISYASYRIALLERELVRYEPDLFVLYTGHNEFLEERTYGELRDRSRAMMRLQLWLGRFRFYSLARRGWLEATGRGPRPGRLPAEVDAKLDGWTGLDLYRRDDELRRAVVEHFDYNLRRIAAIARRHDVGLMVVEPISNLKDFSPFKSEHPQTLASTERERFETLLSAGRALLTEGRPAEALDRLEAALVISPEHAETHFRIGRARFLLGEHAAAREAFVRAKDLDVAPLRALEEIVAVVRAVAADEELPLIDLPAILEADCEQRYGHRILGDEYLQDHVHPDLPVHSLIAERLLDRLVERGVARPAAGWGESRRREIYEREMASLDRAYYAQRDLNLAKVLGWAGKLEEAEAPLERAVAALPEHPEAHLNLGIVYDRTGRSRLAVGSLQRAIELDPEMPEPRFNLGVALGRLGRLDEAVEALREAIRLRPAYREAYYNLGVLERRRGQPEPARAALEKALELRPGSPEIERQLSLLESGGEPEAPDAAAQATAALELARQGRLGEARKALEGVIAEHPGHAPAHYDLGVVLTRLGEAAAAIAAYERSLELDPSNSRARNNLAIRYAAAGRLEAARQQLTRALELDPGYAEAAFNLGVVSDQAGDPEGALEWIERALELDPENGRFHLAAGRLYQALGDPERARFHLEKAGAGAGPQ